MFFSQPQWSWAITLTKISIAFMIRRIKNSLRWRIFLYTMMAIQIATAITANVLQLSQCRPIAAAWDPSIRNAKCLSIRVSQIAIIAIAIIGVVTDVIFTSLPLYFISNIRRPFREKVVLVFLIGLGIVASIASIVKSTKGKRVRQG
jgi:hypothetical protein